MDFTDALRNIEGLTKNEVECWLFEYQYNQAQIETYILSEQGTVDNHIRMYVIITIPNESESLKSIAIIKDKDDRYLFNGLWPKLSFFEVYDYIKTGKSITPFWEDWVKRLEQLDDDDLQIEQKAASHERIWKVANNKKGKAKDDLNIYPKSLKRRAVRNNKRDKIGKNQQSKIKENFGDEALWILKQSIFTITFSPNPLDQKTINLMDLPEE
ncbi:hypothetical protein [Lactiplantibacillus plantarum]|uniref:hypothetical protein n=2 Tax=Lactiplantibacillus plantarum TaxID=1590 RepID=UPI003C1C4CFC